MPCRSVRDTLGKKPEGLLPQVQFVLWIVLGSGFVPPVINMYV